MTTNKSSHNEDIKLVAESTHNLLKMPSEDYLPYINQFDDRTKSDGYQHNKAGGLVSLERESSTGVNYIIDNSVHKTHNTNIIYLNTQGNAAGCYETMVNERTLGGEFHGTDLFSINKSKGRTLNASNSVANETLLRDYLMCTRDPGYQPHLLSYKDVQLALNFKEPKRNKSRKSGNKSMAYKNSNSRSPNKQRNNKRIIHIYCQNSPDLQDKKKLKKVKNLRRYRLKIDKQELQQNINNSINAYNNKNPVEYYVDEFQAHQNDMKILENEDTFNLPIIPSKNFKINIDSKLDEIKAIAQRDLGAIIRNRPDNKPSNYLLNNQQAKANYQPDFISLNSDFGVPHSSIQQISFSDRRNKNI